jgi:CBS domain-containing protein
MEVADPVAALLNHKEGALWRVAPDAMVFAAIRLMSEKSVGALLVTEEDKLIGIVSERDYTRKVILRGKSSRETPVRDIMSTDVTCVNQGDSVERCMQIMTERKVRHLPVLRDGKLVGIVSIGDIVKWIISAQSALIGHLDNYIAGTYPA